MLYDYLAEFVTVAREKSLSKAALKLSLSQSSLSRHMQALETNLGMRLLNRKADGVELTPDGEIIFNKAADMVDIMDDIVFYSSKTSAAERITVCNLDLYPAYARSLIEVSEGLVRNGKSVQCKMLSKADLEGLPFTTALDSGRISLYAGLLTEGLRTELVDRYEVVELYHQNFCAVMDPDNPLASRERLVLADLEGMTLIHAESNYHSASIHWTSFKSILRDRGIKYQSLTYPLNDETDYFVSFGSGILVLSAGYKAVDLLRAAGKAAIDVQDACNTLYAVFRKDDDLVCELVAKVVEGGSPRC